MPASGVPSALRVCAVNTAAIKPAAAIATRKEILIGVPYSAISEPRMNE